MLVQANPFSSASKVSQVLQIYTQICALKLIFRFSFLKNDPRPLVEPLFFVCCKVIFLFEIRP